MAGLFETATSLMDRRQLTSIWLPLIAFVAGICAVLVSAAGWTKSKDWWAELGGAGQTALVITVLLATVVASQVLSTMRMSLIQIYEGYWPRVVGVDWLKDQLTKRHMRHQQNRRPERPDLFLTYPRSEADVLPTRLGNILRAAEEHAQRYGIRDPVAAWTRLYVVLPDSFVQSFAAAAANLETAVTISSLGAVFAVAGGVLGATLLPWYGAAACVWAGALVAVLGYRAAVRAAFPYAQLVRTAFDVHRFALLEAMRLRLPPRFDIEQQQWDQLGKVWYNGWPDSQRASLLRYPQSEETVSADHTQQAERAR
jgi:hypothetical protein